MSSLYATGYVHAMLDENQDFAAFVWNVARGSGALGRLRDYTRREMPTPLAFDPEPYHAERLAETEAEYDRYSLLSQHQRHDEARAERDALIASLEQSRARRREACDRVLAMRAEVEAWQPPTREHASLKTYMVDQLTSSLDKDGGYTDREIANAKAKTLTDLVLEKWRRLERDRAYHTEEYAKEVNRTAENNRWIAALNSSVPIPAATPHGEGEAA